VNRRDLYEKAIGYLEDAESIYNEAGGDPDDDGEEEIYQLCRKAEKIAHQLGWGEWVRYASHLHDFGIFDLWEEISQEAYEEGLIE
jgi:hypothetical protein